MDRFPLVLSSNEIRELPAGDNLDLSNSSIVNASSISANIITVNGQNVLEAIDWTDIQNAPSIPTSLSQLTNDIGLTVDNDFNTITNTPTTLVGYGITDAATDTQGALAVSALQPGSNISQLNNDSNFITIDDVAGEITVNPTGDLQGSVYADDSTVLVDGVAGKIVGPVDTASITQSDTGNFTSNFTTTITQDNQYTKFTKVDVFDDGEFVNTINREIKLGANSLLFDSTVGASAVIGNSSVGGSLLLEASTGNASEGNADGGDIVITSGAGGVGGDGGNIILNSNADIFVGPLANTLDIRIGGGPGYAGENNTFFYGNVNIDSGKKLDTESVTNSSGNLTLDSTSGAVIIGTNATQTIINGDVDFGNSGTIDFTGATVTGVTVSGDINVGTVQGTASAALNIYRGAGGTVSLGDASSGDVTVSDSGINITSTGGVAVNGAVGATVSIGTGGTAGDVTIGKVGNTTTITGGLDLDSAVIDWVPIVSDVIINNGLPVGTKFTQPVPTTSNGASGDTLGTVAFDGSYIYYCTATYTDGVADIWKRVAWSADTW